MPPGGTAAVRVVRAPVDLTPTPSRTAATTTSITPATNDADLRSHRVEVMPPISENAPRAQLIVATPRWTTC